MLINNIKNLPNSWLQCLESEFQKDYFKNLNEFLNGESVAGKSIFPPINEIFASFQAASFENVKVVILGQDPYHGAGQANGLCFSVNDGMALPPSLVNIFKELESDCDVSRPKSGNLMAWANQGVLLLNAILSVEESKAASHQKIGWEKFTDAVIRIISEQKEDVVFMLWGSYAHKKGKVVDSNKHYVLKTGHPSPLSANRGYWFGNKSFSKCNAYLKAKGKSVIDWSLS